MFLWCVLHCFVVLTVFVFIFAFHAGQDGLQSVCDVRVVRVDAGVNRVVQGHDGPTCGFISASFQFVCIAVQTARPLLFLCADRLRISAFRVSHRPLSFLYAVHHRIAVCLRVAAVFATRS